MATDIRSHRRRISGLGALLAISVLAAACGSTDDASPADDASAAAGEPADDDALAALEADFAGTDREPPTTGPPPQPGQSAWVISCGESNEGCRIPADGAREAAELVGWDATVFDGKFDPAEFGAGIRQAVAANADAIILVAIDCQVVQQPLAEAKAAGITVVGAYSYDCTDPRSGGSDAESLFSATVEYDTSPAEFYGANYAKKAELMRATLPEDEGVKVLNITQHEFINVYYGDVGFVEAIEECTSCEIVEDLPITGQDVANSNVTPKVLAALQRHPEANAVHIPYDGLALLGVSQAIVESGRKDDLFVVAGEGFAPAIDLLQQDAGIDAELALPARWVGWASIDTVNRVQHGEEPVDSGIGWRMITRDRGASEFVDGYEGTADYQTAYRQAWGVTE